MIAVPPEVWSKLTGERVHGETLWARRALPEISGHLIAALDGQGQRHFLVILQNGEDPLHDNQTRGLTVQTRDLVVPDHKTGKYLDITCHDPAGHEAFDLFGGELAT